MCSVLKNKVHEDIFTTVSKNLKIIAKYPDLFPRVKLHKNNGTTELLDTIYTLALKKDRNTKSSPEILPKLHFEDLDEEQIWQQIDIRNVIVLPQFIGETSKFLSLSERNATINFVDDDDNEQNDDEAISEKSFDDMEVDSENSEESNDEEQLTKSFKSKMRSSIVDDKHFKLAEMEEFLKNEEAKEFNKNLGKSSENDDDIDYFQENLGFEEDEDEEDKDFFGSENDEEGNPEANDNSENLSYDNEEEDVGIGGDGTDFINNDEDSFNSRCENKDMIKTSFELKQERLKERIDEYENDILGEKPWQLKGEIQGSNRPQNSLLEEILEFDGIMRPAPIITEKTSQLLEDIIKQRIKDQAWDDVVFKVKAVQKPQEYRKQLILDQEKSKESLAQIYEKEFRNNCYPKSLNVEEYPKEHKEIHNLMMSLFSKLDALSNYNFTPKYVGPEPKIVTNTPVVNIEEVAPVLVSTAQLLAPEEIRKREKGAVIGKSEQSKTDKKRNRRLKKQKQKAIAKIKTGTNIQKQNPTATKFSNKDKKIKLLKNGTMHEKAGTKTNKSDISSLKSSKAFFSKLQE